MISSSQVICNFHTANFENFHVFSRGFLQKYLDSQLNSGTKSVTVNSFLSLDLFFLGRKKQRTFEWEMLIMAKKRKLILGKQNVICFNNFMVDFDEPWKKKNCCFYELHRSSSNKAWPEPSPPFPPHDHVKWNPQVPSANVHLWRNLTKIRSKFQTPTGGLFVLTTNVAAPEFYPLGGKPHNRGLCLPKIMSFAMQKKHVLLLIPDSSR